MAKMDITFEGEEPNCAAMIPDAWMRAHGVTKEAARARVVEMFYDWSRRCANDGTLGDNLQRLGLIGVEDDHALAGA